jgi:hypothetical protein
MGENGISNITAHAHLRSDSQRYKKTYIDSLNRYKRDNDRKKKPNSIGALRLDIMSDGITQN